MSTLMFLFFSIDGYPRQCKSCQKKIPVAAVVAGSLSFVAIIIIVLVLIFIFKRKNPSVRKGSLEENIRSIAEL